MAVQNKTKAGNSFWGPGGEIESLEIDMAQLEKILLVLPKHIVPMIWGPPGIGKTQTVGAVARKLGAGLRTIVTSTYEPTDIGGVPMPVTVEGATRYVRYLVAKWAWDATVESGNNAPIILFFDDLATAHEQVQAACYRVFLEKVIGDLELHENVRVYGAGNRPEDNAATHNMPTPLANRMMHLYATYSPDSWVNWAVDNGVHHWLVSYIRTHGQQLCTFDADASEKAMATPRTLHMLSDTLLALESAGMNNDRHADIRFRVTAGLVSKGWATNFFHFVKVAERAIGPQQIIKDPEKAPLPKELDLAHVTVAACERWLKDHKEDWAPILKYTLRLEPEVGIILAFKISNIVLNLPQEERMANAMNPDFLEMQNRWGKFWL